MVREPDKDLSLYFFHDQISQFALECPSDTLVTWPELGLPSARSAQAMTPLTGETAEGASPTDNQFRPATLRNWNIGAYIRDQRNVTPKVTASVGLRWEYYSTHNENSIDNPQVAPYHAASRPDQIRSDIVTMRVSGHSAAVRTPMSGCRRCVYGPSPSSTRPDCGGVHRTCRQRLRPG
jgi:hypothetical protein